MYLNNEECGNCHKFVYRERKVTKTLEIVKQRRTLHVTIDTNVLH